MGKKGLRLSLKNSSGTIYRVDKIKCLRGHIPSEVDLVRRYMLCLMSGKGYKPYVAALNPEVFQEFYKIVGDSMNGNKIYPVYDDNNVMLFEICKGD